MTLPSPGPSLPVPAAPSAFQAGDGDPAARPGGDAQSQHTGEPFERALVRHDSDAQLLSARLVASRRPGQWAGAAVLLVLLAMLVNTLVTNPRFQWRLVGDYFLSGSVVRGLVLTLWLTAAVMACGFLLGIGLAAMRLSGNPILRSLSFGYVWLVRSVPPLVQLLFWYEIASLYPQLSRGVPFGYILVPHITPGGLDPFVDKVVPLLQERGAFRAEYTGTTLRDHLGLAPLGLASTGRPAAAGARRAAS